MGRLVPQMPCPRLSSAWAVLPSSSSPASIYFLSLLMTLKTVPHRTPHRSVQAALAVGKLQESYSTCGARSFCCKKCNLLNAGLSIVLVTMSNSADTAMHLKLHSSERAGLHSRCWCHPLQEATYDGAEAAAVSVDMHPKLKVLQDLLADDAEYESICGVLRRMLPPNLQSRCSFSNVLSSGLFTLGESE